VQALRAAGAQVLSLAPLGHGVPDLLVSRSGRLYLLEVKGLKGGLTPDQVAFHALWPEVQVVRNVDEAFAAVGVRLRA
jgi:hypothetical protein